MYRDGNTIVLFLIAGLDYPGTDNTDSWNPSIDSG